MKGCTNQGQLYIIPANISPPKLKKEVIGQLKPHFHLYLSSLVPTCDANANAKANDVHKSNANSRPFYRYGGHIELIRFKEYYRMPMGHEHISFVFSSAFRDIFS